MLNMPDQSVSVQTTPAAEAPVLHDVPVSLLFNNDNPKPHPEPHPEPYMGVLKKTLLQRGPTASERVDERRARRTPSHLSYRWWKQHKSSMTTPNPYPDSSITTSPKPYKGYVKKDFSNLPLDDSQEESNTPLPSSSHSKLLDLPPELRDRIYHFVSINELLHLKDSKLPAMFLVNKQVRQEFKKVFWNPKIPMMKAYYIDDRVRSYLRPVPGWLLVSLMFCNWRWSSFHDGMMEPEDPSSRRTKAEALQEIGRARQKQLEQDAQEILARDPRTDEVLLHFAKWLRGEGQPLLRRQNPIPLPEPTTRRFCGYLELAGDGSMLALFSFEKFLLSEDVWMKVDINRKADALWFLSDPYRTDKATKELQIYQRPQLKLQTSN